MKWTAEDWSRLGSRIRAQREGMGLSRERIADLADTSPRTIQNAEEGRVPSRWPPTFARIERALGWDAGSALAVLDGCEPTETEVNDPPRAATSGPLAFERDAARGAALGMAHQVRDAADRILNRLGKDETDVAVAAARLVTLAASLAQHAAVLQVINDIPTEGDPS